LDAVCVGPGDVAELASVEEAEVEVDKSVEVDNSEEGSSEVVKETTLEHGSAGFVGGSPVGRGISEMIRPVGGGRGGPGGPGGPPPPPPKVGQGIGFQAGMVMPKESGWPDVRVIQPPVGVLKTGPIYVDVWIVVCADESTVVNVEIEVVCRVTSLVIVKGLPPVVEVTIVVGVSTGVTWNGA